MSNEGQQPAGAGKGLLAFGTLGTILIGVFAPLIVWATKKDEMQGKDKDVIRKLLNFEITLFIVAVILNFIPIVGQLICLLLGLVNIIVSILAFMALNNEKEFNPPMTYEFIK